MVAKILSRMDYLGHSVSGRTYHKSYRDKRSFNSPRENWIITENAHERIVDTDTWERVQKLRENTKRKSTKMGELGALNGLMYCYDCNKRLRIQRDHKTKFQYYVCPTYQSSRAGHRECSIHCTPRHFIEPLILGEIQRVTAFAREHEADFVALVEKTHARSADNELRSAEIELDKAQNRTIELDRIIKRIYEDNVAGRLTNERFDKLYSDYEAEQAGLKSKMDELSMLLKTEKENYSNITRFLGLVKKYTDVSELTAEIVRIFIDRIVVHKSNGLRKERTQQIDIYFNFIGHIEE